MKGGPEHFKSILNKLPVASLVSVPTRSPYVGYFFALSAVSVSVFALFFALKTPDSNNGMLTVDTQNLDNQMLESSSAPTSEPMMMKSAASNMGGSQEYTAAPVSTQMTNMAAPMNTKMMSAPTPQDKETAKQEAINTIDSFDYPEDNYEEI